MSVQICVGKRGAGSVGEKRLTMWLSLSLSDELTSFEMLISFLGGHAEKRRSNIGFCVVGRGCSVAIVVQFG